MLAISPRYDLSKLASGLLDDKIDVYEDQVLGWIVHPAKLMFANPHSGFAVLTLALTYFEPLGQSLAGRVGNSYASFKSGWLAVYSTMPDVHDEIMRDLYSQLRCGTFHQGFAKGLTRITADQDKPVVLHGNGTKVHTLIVNPWRLLEDVEYHVTEHCAELRVPTDPRRENFGKWFERRAA